MVEAGLCWTRSSGVESRLGRAGGSRVESWTWWGGTGSSSVETGWMSRAGATGSHARALVASHARVRGRSQRNCGGAGATSMRTVRT